jgi:uncharacterized HAD superfamily protein
MIIGVDIDGVISDIVLSLNKELEKLGYVNYDYSDWLTTVHNCDLSDSIFQNPLFWKNMKPFDDAWHQLNHWWSLGHDVYLVTSRRSEVSMSALDSWLNSWNILHNNYYFTDMGSKYDKLKELNVDFMIEDNHNEAMMLNEKGIRCFLRRAWYNSECWGDLETIGSLYDLIIDDNKIKKV